MCKYCTTNIEERENYVLTPNNSSYGNDGIKVEKIISQSDGETAIYFTDDKMIMRNGESVKLAMAYRIPFEYCPFCGRKLEDTENV